MYDNLEEKSVIGFLHFLLVPVTLNYLFPEVYHQLYHANMCFILFKVTFYCCVMKTITKSRKFPTGTSTYPGGSETF